MPSTRISPVTRQRAKALRRNMTDAERRLWTALSALNKAGVCRFRRQAPVGPFIAEFADFGRKLVIEIDGGQHADSQRDARRDAWFAAQGFRVLRYWNNDVLGNTGGVIEALQAALAETTPSSILPHEGGGGEIGAASAPSPLVGEGRDGGRRPKSDARDGEKT